MQDQRASANDRVRKVGRGAQSRPANRFASRVFEADLSYLDSDDEAMANEAKVKTVYYLDDSQSIVSENSSPDIPFRYSVNPYRGCLHGCSYCYARPTHEYLGFDAGLDFESRILVKPQAAELFRKWLSRKSYEPDVVVFSGVSDCYQPAERHFQVTRQCLQVALEFHQAIGFVTKNSLITRDLDLLQPMAQQGLVHAALSVTSLDQELTRVLEPRTSSPAARLRAIQTLSAAGIPVQVMVAPVIPGLNDHEIPAILQAARDAGAQAASFIVLRLPETVLPVFVDWLDQNRPYARGRVLSRIRSVRDGQLSDSTFGRRHRGSGPVAEQIAQTFRVFANRFGLADRLPALDVERFRVPRGSHEQRWLFDVES